MSVFYHIFTPCCTFSISVLEILLEAGPVISRSDMDYALALVEKGKAEDTYCHQSMNDVRNVIDLCIHI